MEISFSYPTHLMHYLHSLVKRHDARYLETPLDLGHVAQVRLSFEDSLCYRRFNACRHFVSQPYFASQHIS